MHSYDNNAVHRCAGHSCVLCRRICDNIDGACAVAKCDNCGATVDYDNDNGSAVCADASAACACADASAACADASAACADASALTTFNRWLQRQANGGRDRGGCCDCRSTADDYANVRCWMTSLHSSLHRMMSVCNASWPLRSTLNLGVQFTDMR